MSVQASDEETMCLVGIEDCGCIRAVYVLEEGEDNKPAEREAAQWIKQGSSVHRMTVAAFHAHGLRCAERPNGKWQMPKAKPTFGDPSTGRLTRRA